MQCPVIFTRVLVAAATISRLKGEESGDEKEMELAESRPAETRQGSAKASRPRMSGKKKALVDKVSLNIFSLLINFTVPFVLPIWVPAF